MDVSERKITERDMKFLANYANTYYPLSDSIHDYNYVIRETEGFERSSRHSC